MKQDTIAAIATAPGQGGIGIIRISGPEAERILQDVFVPAGKRVSAPESHRLTYGRIMDGEEILDECMAVLMRAPASYTREDVAELQIHGGMQTLRKTLEICLKRGARLAEAGEFTRRAFLNGRIDLSRAEAVMSLISARGEQERQAAVRQMSGRTADFVREASDELYRLQAGLAACIDYPEEISDEEGAGMLKEGLTALIEKLQTSIDERASRLIHEGLRVTLFGVPNTGKSSILNTLTGQEKAIVTDIPGTTRDTVESEILLDGIRILLTDTAGMRETEDPIEQIGVKRSETAKNNADIVLLILDSSRELGEDEIRWLQSLSDTDAVVLNKSDLPDRISEKDILSVRPGIRCMKVSALDAGSLRPILDHFREYTEISDQLAITQPRHLEAVKRAVSCLKDALNTLDCFTPDMAETDLQAAQNALSEITGDRADEKLLDAVFSGFCVGK